MSKNKEWRFLSPSESRGLENSILNMLVALILCCAMLCFARCEESKNAVEIEKHRTDRYRLESTREK